MKSIQKGDSQAITKQLTEINVIINKHLNNFLRCSANHSVFTGSCATFCKPNFNLKTQTCFNSEINK